MNNLTLRERIDSTASITKDIIAIMQEGGGDIMTQEDEEEQTTLPEDRLMKKIREGCEFIKMKIPSSAENIKMAERKKVRITVENMREGALQLVGIMQELRREVEEKEKEIRSLREEATKRTTVNQALPPAWPITTTRSYAAVAKRNTVAISIEHNKKGKTAAEVKKKLTEKVDPVKAKIAISAIRESRRGTVIVECAGREDAEKLRLHLSTTAAEDLKSKELKKSWPRIVLPRIEAETTENLWETIIAQNTTLVNNRGGEEKFRSEIKERYRYGGRGQDKAVSVVAEVSPGLRRQLLEQPINLKWQRVQAVDHISLMQCYQCYGFGHRAKDCKEKEQTCGRCGGKHRYTECTAQTAKCIVCTRANANRKNNVDVEHDAKSNNCPTMNRIRESIIANIDYNGD